MFSKYMYIIMFHTHFKSQIQRKKLFFFLLMLLVNNILQDNLFNTVTYIWGQESSENGNLEHFKKMIQYLFNT